jgi:hypothetical protein
VFGGYYRVAESGDLVDFEIAQRSEGAVAWELLLEGIYVSSLAAELASGNAESLQQSLTLTAHDPARAAGFVFVQVVPADGKVTPVAAVHLTTTDGLRSRLATQISCTFPSAGLDFVAGLGPRPEIGQPAQIAH